MLMLWEDLLPGDVVRFSKEIEEYYRDSAPEWVRDVCNKNHKVLEVIIDNSLIKIKIDKDNHFKFYAINLNGWPIWNNCCNLFEIVSLKDDE